MELSKAFVPANALASAPVECIVGPMHVIRDGRFVLHPRDWRQKPEVRDGGVKRQDVKLSGGCPICCARRRQARAPQQGRTCREGRGTAGVCRV
jgi:hypothetical protein